MYDSTLGSSHDPSRPQRRVLGHPSIFQMRKGQSRARDTGVPGWQLQS